MKKYALVTVTIGDKYKSISDITHPLLSSYAKKISADFIVIDGKKKGQENIVPHFAKLRCDELFDEYDRIIFMDTDIIIRDDCPNLFELVPYEKFGIFKEGQFIPRRKIDLEMASRTYSTPILGIKSPDDWKGEYYNTGVLVASKIHRTVFNPPDFEKMKSVDGAWDYGEQGWINLQLINGCIPIHNFSYRFNRMTIMDTFTGEHRLKSFIVHYAGAPEIINTSNGPISLNDFIKNDIEIWNNCKGDYSCFKRGIYIRVGGGLGDQICAEPVVRYIVEELYLGDNIVIASDWPRIFIHLCNENVFVCKPKEVDNIILKDQPYYKMETLPIPESVFGIIVTHIMVHSTDYSSLSCLKRILPNDKKQIKLVNTILDSSTLIDNIGVDNVQMLSKSIAIHPGRGWNTKTFPKEWWQSVIDGIADSGISVCLIGKDIGDDQGLVDVKCPENGIDFRNKTNIGELFLLISNVKAVLSNDSSPVHIAGAFDPYIILIPTCKNPYHILPFRNGSQSYKTKSLYKKLLIDDICNLPTQPYNESINWIPNGKKISNGMEYDNKDEMKGGDILNYIPDPKDVIDVVKDIMLNN